jgi:predicted AAA+ superfamily ATPase
MQLLEVLYAQEFKKYTVFPRKIDILDEKTIIYGPKKSGKTYLIYYLLQEFNKKDFLYIDFYDSRVDITLVLKKLDQFIKEKNIKLLVLENFDFSFEIPSCEKTIITTISRKDIDGFVSKSLYPFDFEEFISVEKANAELSTIFSNYTDLGTYPPVVLGNRENYIRRFQELIRVICGSKIEFEIYKEFALSQGLQISAFSIFNKVKQNNKISKDKFYEIVQKQESEFMLFFLQKYNSSRSVKKIYVLDFASKSVLTFQKDFKKRFENIIFLELYKRDEEVYFTDFIDFYLPKKELAIISMLFIPLAMIDDRLKRIEGEFKKYSIKKVQLITLDAQESFTRDDIEYEVLPFWNFALGI